MSEEIGEEDYVLATKYTDGDPQDQWAIGFYAGHDDSTTQRRHHVVDSEGCDMRVGGFRRVERIPAAFGDYILEDVSAIEMSVVSLWDHLARYYEQK